MQTQNRPRRVKVGKEPGIYRSRSGSYEFCYRDSDRHLRFETVDGDYSDAVKAKRAKLGDMDRGKRVAPSRQTFAEVAAAWFEQLRVKPRTRERYEANLRLHLLPRFGARKAQTISVDDIAKMVRDLEAEGMAGWSAKNVLVTLSGCMSFATRLGWVPANPVSLLDKGEKPKASKRPLRVLEPDEITAVLEAALDTYRPLLATAIFSGLRLMELLGLRWQDIDTKAGFIHVRSQLSRSGGLVEPKTGAGLRDVVLFFELAAVLRAHRAASPFSQETDFVFASGSGRPHNWRNVETRGFDKAATRARLDREHKPVLHDTRHTFASLLIAQGRDPVFVSKQIGHENVSTTMNIYADLFDRRKYADEARDALERDFGGLLSSAMSTAMSTSTGCGESTEAAEVVVLSGLRG
jgi:integrase